MILWNKDLRIKIEILKDLLAKYYEQGR